MSVWNRQDVDALTSPQEVQVVTRRGDGTLRRPRTIWIVGDGDRVFIRSTNVRDADWFRGALAAGAGQIRSRGTAYDVRFTEVGDEADLAADAVLRRRRRVRGGRSCSGSHRDRDRARTPRW